MSGKAVVKLILGGHFEREKKELHVGSTQKIVPRPFAGLIDYRLVITLLSGTSAVSVAKLVSGGALKENSSSLVVESE